MATTTQTTTMGTEQSNAQLQQLLQILMQGGTPEFKRAQQQRMTEVNRNRAQQATYSKDAAFADAQGLMNQILRQAMEGNIATLTRSAEGAGTSQSSMRALLTQDALTRASEAAAARGLEAAVNYGQVSNQLAGTLEALTRPDNSNIEAILGAIRLMNEANQTQTTETVGGGGGGSSGGGGRTSGSSALGMPDTSSFFNRPGGILSNAQQRMNTAPVVYGPSITPDQMLATIQKGIRYDQPLAGVPNINELYNTGMRF